MLTLLAIVFELMAGDDAMMLVDVWVIWLWNVFGVES